MANNRIKLGKEIPEEAKQKIQELGRKISRLPAGLPDPELTSTGEYIARNNYLRRDDSGQIIETPKEMFWRIAHNIASADLFYAKEAEMKKTREEFYKLLSSLDFVPNTPTFANAAGKLQQLSACFVLPIEDNLDSIGRTLWQTMMIHKTGGGTGFSFSRLRPYGSIVRSTGRTSSGAVYFMWMYADATDRVQQGGYRRGANMGVMKVNHPDILRWITVKSAESIINSFNLSVAITDDFMKKIEDDSRFAPEGLKPLEEELSKIILEIQNVLKNTDLNFSDKVMNFEKAIIKLKALIEAQEEGEGYELVNPDTKEVEARLNARKVFELIARLAWEKGDPGVIFLDKINKDNPTPHLGEIEATNPCIVGSTLISTEHGLMPIEKIVKDKIELEILTDNRVIGGKGVSLRPHNHLWDNGVKEVWRLETKSGFELEATADHKIMTKRGWVPLIELKIGQDKVLIQSERGVFSPNRSLPFKAENIFKGRNGRTYKLNLPQTWSKQLGQVLGFLVGDGWLREGDKNCQVGFTFSESDKDQLEYLKGVLDHWYGSQIEPVKRSNGVWHLSYHSQYFVEFFKKLGVKPVKASEKEVPESLFTAPKEAVVGFLQGLFTADGTVNYRKGFSSYVRLTSKSRKLLGQAQVLLMNLGIPGRIYNRSRKPRKMFPYTNKNGQTKSYICDGICFELEISRQPVLKFLREIGFLKGKHQDKIRKFYGKQYYKEVYSDTVKKVEQAGREKVFDITEPITYSMIANCIVVADCGEQPLLPYESCNLGAINLSRMVKNDKDGKAAVDWEKMGTTIPKAVHFLDNVIDMNRYPLPEIEKMTKGNRKIGLGVMGWAGMIVQLGIPYNCQEAYDLAQKLMNFIRQEAREASMSLAKKRGVFPNWKGSIYDPKSPCFKGEALSLRHAALTTIAPTGTTSMLADVNSGIEPFFALAYKKNIVNGDQVETLNPLFIQIAKERGFWSEDLIEKIKNNKGSVRGLEEVPEEIQKIFPIAADIPTEAHILMQAAFQRGGVDNAISKTINMASSATVDDVIRAYRLAYEQGCKGVTIYRDQSRKKQILVTEQKETGTEVKINTQDGETLKPRPVKVEGATYKIETPLGNAFITVNHDTMGNPFEVFITIGKAGSEVAAMAEGLGRMISTTLRFGNHLPPLERAKEIIDQLRGIGGARSVGFGPNRVRSLPDAIAKAIGMHFGLIEYPGTNISSTKPNGEVSLSPEGELEVPSLESKTAQITLFNHKKDICPGCGEASLIYEEGCRKCSICGYSEC